MYTVCINLAVTVCLPVLVSPVNIVAPLVQSHRHVFVLSEGQAGEKFEHLKQSFYQLLLGGGGGQHCTENSF